MEPYAWCLATELSARGGSLCFDPLIRMFMVKWPDWSPAQQCPWHGGHALLGAEGQGRIVPWHNTHPDTSPGWSHPCLPHPALEQGSPGCSGVFTLPCEHSPPVFICTIRNKGKQIKKKAGTVSICSAPEHWASSMQHSWDLLLLLLCAGSSLPCKGFKLFQELVPTAHRNTKSFVPNLLQCLALKKSGMWRLLHKAMHCFLLWFSLLCAGWFEAFLEPKNPKKELIACLHYL